MCAPPATQPTACRVCCSPGVRGPESTGPVFAEPYTQTIRIASRKEAPMARARYRVYHVVHNPRGGWRVEGASAKRASSWHDNKDQAIERGRALAQKRK